MYENVFLALGCNTGECRKNLHEAINRIANFSEIRAVSSLYITSPYGKKDQNTFLNQVLLIGADTEPEVFLQKLQKAEKEIGRKQREKWGPREIDLDILFWDKLMLNSDTLTIPHYDYLNRDFFLAPAAEIAPDFVPPGQNKELKMLANSAKIKTILGKERAVEPLYSH